MAGAAQDRELKGLLPTRSKFTVRRQPLRRTLALPCGPRPTIRRRHMNLVTRFAKDESGATAIEYGLIAALVSVVIIGALTLLGTNLSTKFNTVASALK